MAVYKRNNSWYCRGQINGERYDEKCDGAITEHEARAIDDGIRYKIRLKQNGLELEKEKVYTFSFLMQRYTETSEANNKSVKESKTYSSLLLEYFGKNKNIKSIKPADLEKFKLYMISEGKSKATVNRYLSALRRAYNILIYNEMINYNPVNKIQFMKENNKRSRVLSQEEWERLKVVLPKYLLNIVLVAMHTGLRKGNVLNLKWEQIDFERNIITISADENKGKKTIVKHINKSLRKLLLSLKPNSTGYVFINKATSKPYTDVKKGFANALERAKIEDFHFHDLRRTTATWLHEQGVPLRVIQGILDHSDISTTERYLSLKDEQSIKAMDILNGII